MPPSASIVINNFNYGRYLGESIESALKQNHPRIEVIIVDDGSTDNSREVIKAFGNRVKAVLKPNGSQASAINEGFKAAIGKLD